MTLQPTGFPNLVLGGIDFLELLLGGLADVFAQGCYFIGMVLEGEFPVGALQLIVGSIGGDTEYLVGRL